MSMKAVSAPITSLNVWVESLSVSNRVVDITHLIDGGVKEGHAVYATLSVEIDAYKNSDVKQEGYEFRPHHKENIGYWGYIPIQFGNCYEEVIEEVSSMLLNN